MRTPKVDNAGLIDIRSVSELSREELATWVYLRLHGTDPVIPVAIGEGDLPHYLLSIVYPKLDRSSREDFQEVVFEFVSSLCQRAPEWLNSAGDELLMLVEPVLGQSRRCEDAIDLLVKFCTSTTSYSPSQPDLQFRALQSLVALRYRATPQFWHDQFRTGGSQYVSLILEGLALIDVSSVFDWLLLTKWNRSVFAGVSHQLPLLIDQYGAAKIASQIERILPRLPSDASQAFFQLCEEEGLTLYSQDGIMIKPSALGVSLRRVDEVTILDLTGRITVGEGNQVLRTAVKDLVSKGNRKILLNLGDVRQIDSSGIGELVSAYTTVRNQGGELKLLNLNKKVHDLLQISNLYFEQSEAAAVQSLKSGGASLPKHGEKL